MSKIVFQTYIFQRFAGIYRIRQVCLVTAYGTLAKLGFVPYKDPEKAKEANRRKQARFRERQRQKRMQGDSTPSETVQPSNVLQFPSPPPAPPGVPLQRPPMSQDEWARYKVLMGQKLCRVGVMALDAAAIGKTHPVGARDAAVYMRLGIDLVNANLFLIQPEQEGPRRGAVEFEDAEFLQDEDYRETLLAALERKQSLRKQQTG